MIPTNISIQVIPTPHVLNSPELKIMSINIPSRPIHIRDPNPLQLSTEIPLALMEIGAVLRIAMLVIHGEFFKALVAPALGNPFHTDVVHVLAGVASFVGLVEAVAVPVVVVELVVVAFALEVVRVLAVAFGDVEDVAVVGAGVVGVYGGFA